MSKSAFGHAFIKPRLSLQTILHYSIINYCPSRKLHVSDHNKIQLILAKRTTSTPQRTHRKKVSNR